MQLDELMHSCAAFLRDSVDFFSARCVWSLVIIFQSDP